MLIVAGAYNNREARGRSVGRLVIARGPEHAGERIRCAEKSYRVLAGLTIAPRTVS